MNSPRTPDLEDELFGDDARCSWLPQNATAPNTVAALDAAVDFASGRRSSASSSGGGRPRGQGSGGGSGGPEGAGGASAAAAAVGEIAAAAAGGRSTAAAATSTTARRSRPNLSAELARARHLEEEASRRRLSVVQT